jgi:hypothetical protein
VTPKGRYVSVMGSCATVTALGLATQELLLKFHLEGYDDEVTTVNKGAGSLFEGPRWPSEVFIRLREKK